MKDKKQAWYRDLVDIGCIVCRNTMGVISPPDIHHVHKNSRRIDDFHTIPLCPLHHRSGVKCDEYVSRHPWKKEFEKRYGNEMDLLAEVQELVREMNIARLNALKGSREQ